MDSVRFPNRRRGIVQEVRKKSSSGQKIGDARIICNEPRRNFLRGFAG